MENKIKIGDFAKITGCTVKTIIYYHKIGLLQEPKRSSGGYRLYGSVELTSMKLIKYLKSLGFDLKKIKEVLGNAYESKTLKEALKSLRIELLKEGEKIQERVGKIDILLEEN
ncbi:MerR family transcriptional regulator, partial [Clostridium drakei]|uniref:HTH merR-type domain-containing protein n=1 Tax=Clostridium drakei TaxID=332101 RepID=A0A2U8DSV6_9CLOT